MLNISLKRTHLKMSFVKGQPCLSDPNLFINPMEFIILTKIKLIAATNNTRNSCGRKWKHIFYHPGWVQTLGIWYVILDSILASNTICGLLIDCKHSGSQVFYEVLDLGTILFFFFFIFSRTCWILFKYSRTCSRIPSNWKAPRHQVHEVLFKSHTSTCWVIMLWIT